MARLTEIYTGVTPDLRKILLSSFNLGVETSNYVLLQKLDSICDKLNDRQVKSERELLLEERAVLSIQNAVNSGFIEESKKEPYIALAINNYETVMGIIYQNSLNKIELSELIKLSGRELYLSGKLERLKELSQYYFELKHKELLQR